MIEGKIHKRFLFTSCHSLGSLIQESLVEGVGFFQNFLENNLNCGMFEPNSLVKSYFFSEINGFNQKVVVTNVSKIKDFQNLKITQLNTSEKYKVTLDKNVKGTYRVYNSLGKLEMKKTVNHSFELDFSNLSNGLYLVNFKSFDGTNYLGKILNR